MMAELESLLSSTGKEASFGREKSKWGMKIGRTKQAAFVWNEESMLMLLQPLRGQSAAMMLLLRAMNAVSMSGMLQILEGGRGTLEVVKSGAASLRGVEEKRGGSRYPGSLFEMDPAEAGKAMSIYDLFGSSLDEPQSPKGLDARENVEVLGDRRSLAGQVKLPFRNKPANVAYSEAVSLNADPQELRSPPQASGPPLDPISVAARKPLASPLSPMPPGAQPQPPADRNLVQEPVLEDSPWL